MANWRHVRVKLGVSVCSMLLALVAAETVVRIAKGRLTQTDNFLRDELDITRSHLPTMPDPELGWTLQSSFRGEDNPWRARVSTDESGLRRNRYSQSAVAPSTEPRILAIGDSFTFGEEVSDEDTWPARLEEHLHQPVLNGGVSGYGCDQVVLRAYRLIPKFTPSLVIFSIYHDDITRTQMSMRFGAFKPFYTLDGDGLRLRNSPVPAQTIVVRDLGRAQFIFGHSLLLHQIFRTYHRSWWLAGTFGQHQEHDDGVEVTRRLIQALKVYCDRHDAVLVLATQYNKGLPRTADDLFGPVMNYARQIGVLVFDPGDELRALSADDPQAFKLLFTHHMTPDGNEWFASRMARFLEDSGTLAHIERALVSD